MTEPHLAIQRLRAAVDALAYATVLTALALVGSMTLSVMTGGGAVRGNVIFFLLGWIVMAYATVRLWPTSRAKDDPTDPASQSITQENETRLQTSIRRFGPVRLIELPPPDQRIGIRGQLFLSSLVILATSFTLEMHFGVS